MANIYNNSITTSHASSLAGTTIEILSYRLSTTVGASLSITEDLLNNRWLLNLIAKDGKIISSAVLDLSEKIKLINNFELDYDLEHNVHALKLIYDDGTVVSCDISELTNDIIKLYDNIAAEEARAIQAELDLKNLIESLNLELTGSNGKYIKYISQSAGQVTAEAQSFDTDLDDATHENAPTTLATKIAIDAETRRATKAENKLSADLLVESTVREQMDAEIRSYVNEEISISREAERTLASNIDSEKDRASKAEQLIRKETVEIATNLENAIEQTQQALVTEQQVRETADNSLSAAIDLEEAERKAEDAKLKDRIDALSPKGKFLSTWDCTVGLPISFPETLPYEYHAGDYYIVDKIASAEGEVNYRPAGAQFTGEVSTVLEEDAVDKNAYYIYDSIEWILADTTAKAVTFSSIVGDAKDNDSIKNYLDTIESDINTIKDDYLTSTDKTELGVAISTGDVETLNTAKAYADEAIDERALWEAGSGEHSIQSKGTGCVAQGNYSVAEGWTSKTLKKGTDPTSGQAAHAEGAETNASGFAAHAEGGRTSASGTHAHAEGYETTALGGDSHAEGHHTITNNFGEHAEGCFNVSHMNSGTYGDALNTQHSIGIGTAEVGPGGEFIGAKNAFEVMQNGDAYLIGIGGYDGKNIDSADTLQEVINKEVTYDDLDNIPIINQDLSADGFIPIEGTYYRHTGATQKPIVPLITGETYTAIYWNTSLELNNVKEQLNTLLNSGISTLLKITLTNGGSVNFEIVTEGDLIAITIGSMILWISKNYHTHRAGWNTEAIDYLDMLISTAGGFTVQNVAPDQTLISAEPIDTFKFKKIYYYENASYTAIPNKNVELSWGKITGDISNQTDLADTLNTISDTLSARINNKSRITASDTGTSTNKVSYITIDNYQTGATEYKLAGGEWGEITGTLANQTDLINYINGVKADLELAISAHEGTEYIEDLL